jgi:hypothetical protein
MKLLVITLILLMSSSCLVMKKGEFSIQGERVYKRVAHLYALELNQEEIYLEENGDDVLFHVRLKGKPSSDVNISLSSNDLTEGAISPTTLIFTESNWNSWQVITLSPVDDSADDGEVDFDIDILVSSLDLRFDALLVPSLTFTTRSDDDAAPSLVSVLPLDNASSVSSSSDLVLNFNEAVEKANAGQLLLKRTSDDSVFQTFDLSAPSGDEVVVTGTQVNIDLSPLENGVSYYVEIPSGFFQDTSANSNQHLGINDSLTWNFQIEDNAAPSLSSFNPIDDSNGVAVNLSALSLTFDENIYKASAWPVGNDFLWIKRTDNDAIVMSFDFDNTDSSDNGTLAIVGNTLTLTLDSNLSSNLGLYVEIAPLALADYEGNSYSGLSDKNIWNFDTEDISAPTLTSLSPLDGDTEIAVDSDLVLHFDKNIMAGSGTIALYLASNNQLVQSFDVSSEILISGNTVTITPSSSLLHMTSYYVLVDNGAIIETSSQQSPYAGISNATTWNFSTLSYSVLFSNENFSIYAGHSDYSDDRSLMVYSNASSQVVLRDLTNNTSEIISRDHLGNIATGLSPRISGDGLTVVFASGSLLVPGDLNQGGGWDIYKYDVLSGNTTLITQAEALNKSVSLNDWCSYNYTDTYHLYCDPASSIYIDYPSPGGTLTINNSDCAYYGDSQTPLAHHNTLQQFHWYQDSEYYSLWCNGSVYNNNTYSHTYWDGYNWQTIGSVPYSSCQFNTAASGAFTTLYQSNVYTYSGTGTRTTYYDFTTNTSYQTPDINFDGSVIVYKKLETDVPVYSISVDGDGCASTYNVTTHQAESIIKYDPSNIPAAPHETTMYIATPSLEVEPANSNCLETTRPNVPQVTSPRISPDGNYVAFFFITDDYQHYESNSNCENVVQKWINLLVNGSVVSSTYIYTNASKPSDWNVTTLNRIGPVEIDNDKLVAHVQKSVASYSSISGPQYLYCDSTPVTTTHFYNDGHGNNGSYQSRFGSCTYTADTNFYGGSSVTDITQAYYDPDTFMHVPLICDSASELTTNYPYTDEFSVTQNNFVPYSNCYGYTWTGYAPSQYNIQAASGATISGYVPNSTNYDMLFMTFKRSAATWNSVGNFDFNVSESINPMEIALSPVADEFIFLSSQNLSNLESTNNGTADIYRARLDFSAIELLTKNINGVVGDSGSLYPVYSADGASVDFRSHSTNLFPGAAPTYPARLRKHIDPL